MATWRLEVRDLSGTVLAQDANFVRLRATWALDAPGSLEVDVPARDVEGSTVWAAGRRRLVLYRGALAVWGGFLVRLEHRSSVGQGDEWKANALGYAWALERLVVVGSLSYSSTVATDIAWGLVQHAKNLTDSPLSFVTLGSVSGTAPARTRHYCDADGIAEALRELAELEPGGFDWELDAAGRLNMWVPRRAANTGTLVMPGVALEMEVSEDATDLATYATAIGADPDGPCGPPSVRRSSSLASSYGRREVVVEADSASSAELTEVADGELTRRGNARLQVRATAWTTFGFEDDFERKALGPNWTERHFDGTGSVSLDGSTVTVDSSGSGDFWSTSDTGSMIYRTCAPTPSRVEVDVVDPGVTQGGANQSQRLLMARQVVSQAGTPFVGLTFDSDASHITMFWRSSSGGSATWSGENSGVPWDPAKPLRLRFDLDGSKVVGYVSQDEGATWNQVGTVTAVANVPWACLCAAAYGAGRVKYDNFVVQPWPGLWLGDRPRVLVGLKNYVSNNGFESGSTSPWGAMYGATLSVDTTEKYAGNYSLKVVTPTSGSQPGASQHVGYITRAGVVWTFSAYVKAPAGSRIFAAIEWRNNNWGAGYQAGSVVTATGGWDRVSVTATAPRDATSANVQVRQDATNGPSITFYVDEAQLEIGGAATDVVPGRDGPFGDPYRAHTMRCTEVSVELSPPHAEFVEALLEAT